ncbi:MRP family ATP-binding protein [Helicobacter cholecystus]|uniref:Iron-sulfur cluster carrier protein n=1 Tax=Helicobacter cholecystus TaxID=45498 RepID=A0A3D8IV11_9HELI|nr:Mrp/NBP35 family ATP-binding protein [Helicobacter cholecystus]RDU68816.1 MRP family ATP-binding protein [Helicobacter cholecystus]VEJ23906.1 ATP/GTP-binding protein [Helicobacter cholecystus]
MKEKIQEALKGVKYSNFDKDILTFGFVKNIVLENDGAKIYLEIPSSSPEVSNMLRDSILKALQPLGLSEVLVEIKTPQVQEKKVEKKNIAPQIKHFVMISSGKGGVGKSTTSVNLAIALAQSGKRVGLLDADIYGPNIPRMLGLNQTRPQVSEELKKLAPLKAYGVEMMSMGVLYEEGQSLIWRGPMIMRAIEQLLTDVLWSELDVLVIDMPPGTGDAQLTLAQSVPVSAGITVSTPQSVSLDDSERSLDMFKKLNIPIAGIIENMSGFICPNCGQEYDIFGKGTTGALATKFATEVLAQVPLEPQVREGGDSGKPIAFFQPTSKSAQEYLKASQKLLAFLDEVESRGGVDNASIQPTQDHSHLH